MARLQHTKALGVLLGTATALILEGAGPAAAVAQAARRSIAGVPVIRVDEVRYEVTGLTPAEILEAMRSGGPHVDGTAYFGYTRWDINWSFRYDRSGTGCRMTSVAVNLTARVELPEWRAPDDADTSLRADWADFLGNLRTHEQGHVDLAKAAARDIQRALERMELPVCEMMSANANAVGRRRLRSLDAQQVRYDQETRRGATQGAVWPVRRGSGSSR